MKNTQVETPSCCFQNLLHIYKYANAFLNLECLDQGYLQFLQITMKLTIFFSQTICRGSLLLLLTVVPSNYGNTTVFFHLSKNWRSNSDRMTRPMWPLSLNFHYNPVRSLCHWLNVWQTTLLPTLLNIVTL